jgi:inner membrane protein
MENNTAKNWFKESITFKLIMIGVLSLLLLIPAGMVKRLIREREKTRNEVINEINSKWGYQQTITGPLISVPFIRYYKEDDKILSSKHYVHILPDNLEVKGEIFPEIRYRSIYKVIVYNTRLNIKGYFSSINFEGFKVPEKNILWDEAVIYVGIPDMRGINKDVKININGKPQDVNPGIPIKSIVSSGITSNLDVNKNDKLVFDLSLDLNGSESLYFFNVGKTTSIEMSSDWTTPSFDGAFLPDERNVDNSGFTASWSVLDLNRNYPQKWIDSDYYIDESAFGVKLLIPVDQYQKSERSVKYAIMFVGLTFLIFFFSEVINRIHIHPIQYFLVGIALVVFYSLLISLSEHMSFSLAYLISSVPVILLVTLYYRSILRKKLATFIMGLIMIFLYVFLFVILQLQDYSLLMGSIGLFVVIAVIMYLSRKIDWSLPISKGSREE